MSDTTGFPPTSAKAEMKPPGLPPQKSVTLKDIAQHVGLSHRTVSQALNGTKESTSKVSDKTRLRIQVAAKKLGYRPNRAARALRTGSGGLLGILNFQGLQHFGAVRLHGALQETRLAGVPFLVYQATRQKSVIVDACHALLDAAVDGVLLLAPPAEFDQECLNIFLSRNRPVVSVGGTHLKRISRYVADQENGFGVITRHLIDEGCRNLCLMTLSSDRKRFPHSAIAKAFRATIEAAPSKKRKVSGRIHYIGDPRLTVDLEVSPIPQIHVLHVSGYLGMQEIIASGDLPDAVLCRIDTFAQGALRACQEANIAVPGQIAITGHIDEPASSAGWLPITSVGYSHEKLIRPAIAELGALIRGERQLQGRSNLIPGELAIRQSSMRRSFPGPSSLV